MNDNRPIRNLLAALLFLAVNTLSAQERIIYKEIDTIRLTMDVYYPENISADRKYPAMVVFFGGGWKKGSTRQFEPHAEYFSHRGIVVFLANYRVEGRHGTTPFESLKDAKSAIRFVRANADRFRIHPDSIVASGGSAGGHLAAAASLTGKYSDERDPRGISPKANALVLFNPVLDNGPGGYGYERIGEAFVDFSPLHNLREGAPPTVIFLGTKDALIPVETMEYYKVVMEKVGSRCDLHLYEGQPHGFFNLSEKSEENFRKTVLEADRFLESLGFLKGPPDEKYLDKVVKSR